MPVTIVAGVQWGDEGKGRIVDLLASEADIVVRCQGGPNAGHTIVNDKGKFVLHTVPSGVFNPKSSCIIGAGTVVNPVGVVEELKGLAEAGIDLGKILISERAHLIMPYHRLLDRADEARRSKNKIGTTGQGIAPAYADKVLRCGFRAGDLLDMSKFRARLVDILDWKNQNLKGLYAAEGISVDEVMSQIEPAAEFMREFIGDTVDPLADAIAQGKRVMLEGQLGVMRDLDWGAYPFVTSSSPTPAGMCAGAGVPPQAVDRVIGIVKAYTTTVGEGPFPTELKDSVGDVLREYGGEYGATTGRPRRCGWFDMVAVRWACRVAGFTELALTKVDILDKYETIPFCVKYEENGAQVKSFPTTGQMSNVAPVYDELPGWNSDTTGIRRMEDLPAAARDYIDRIERDVETPVKMVSVGPQREAIIERR